MHAHTRKKTPPQRLVLYTNTQARLSTHSRVLTCSLAHARTNHAHTTADHTHAFKHLCTHTYDNAGIAAGEASEPDAIYEPSSSK